MVRGIISSPLFMILYEGKANSIQLTELDDSDCWMGFFQPFGHDNVNDSLQKEEGIVIQLSFAGSKIFAVGYALITEFI